MKVGSPIDIYNTVTVNYTVTTSPDDVIPEYDPLKTDYAQSDVVKVAADRKKYKLASLTVAAGVIPNQNPTIWFSSPLAEFAMFKYDNEYATEITGNQEFLIENANSIDTIFLQGIDGDTVTIELLDGSDKVLDTLVEDIYDWEIEDFNKYLFPDELVLKNKLQFDFIELELEKIRVTIAGATTKCRYFVVCFKEEIGMTMWDGIGYNQNNFFTTERDPWGNLIDTNLRVVEDVTLPVRDYSAQANININRISRLFAKPNLWMADDRDKRTRDNDFINMFGTLVSNSAVPGAAKTDKTLKIWGK